MGRRGVGKSSLAKRIAEEKNIFNLNSGAFYRAIAVKILDLNKQHAPEEEVIKTANETQLDIIRGLLYLDGEEVESRLRSDLADHWSSVVSAIVPVRHAVNRQLRRIARGMSLVAEGRDMTTVVFPSAEVKIYLTASLEVRARRRFDQKTSEMSLSQIGKIMRDRDYRDSHKEEGSLTIAKDAIVLDTSSLTLDEVYNRVIKLI